MQLIYKRRIIKVKSIKIQKSIWDDDYYVLDITLSDDSPEKHIYEDLFCDLTNIEAICMLKIIEEYKASQSDEPLLIELVRESFSYKEYRNKVKSLYNKMATDHFDVSLLVNKEYVINFDQE